MKKSTWIIICICMLVFIFFMTCFIIPQNQKNSQIMADSPEQAVESALNIDGENIDIQYQEEGNFLFAVANNGADSLGGIVLKRDKVGNYFSLGKPKFVGENVPSEIRGNILFPSIYKEDDQWVICISVDGEGGGTKIGFSAIITDVSKIKVYDSEGIEFKNIENNNFAWFYQIKSELPNNYQIYADYDGKTYTIMDVNAE